MKFAYLLAALPSLMTQAVFAQCPTIPHPAADSIIAFPHTTAEAFAAIDAQHVAEGVCARCSPGGSMIETYLPDPATYAALNPDQKVLLLINAERIIRGIPPILGPGGTVTGVNDPFIGNIMANHSLLVANNAATWWDLGIVHNDAVDGTFGSRETAPLGPPGLVSNGAGEIIAVDFSVEGAIFEWMYNDQSSNWGHRDNILNCAWTLMGAGVAASEINTMQWGAGAMVITVDFITPLPSSTYTAPILPAPAPCPTRLATWTCPTVVAPKVFGDTAPGGLTLNADGTITIAANVSVDPLDNAANQVRAFLVFQPANWGSPALGVTSLGEAPQGAGGFSCPLIPVLHGSLDPADPAVADQAAVSSRCAASIPFAGNPVVVAVTDTYNNVAYMTLNLIPPM